MSDRRFDWTHAAALAIGAAACFAIMFTGSPKVGDYSPQVRQLTRRLNQITREKAASDSGLAFYRTTRIPGMERAIARLEAEGQAARQSSRRYAVDNRRLVDSVRAMILAHPDSVTPILTQLSAGIANQDSACTLAVGSCEATKDSLRVQITERDSIVTDRTAQRDSAFSVAHDGKEATQRAEAETASRGRALLVARVVAILALIGAVLK